MTTGAEPFVFLYFYAKKGLSKMKMTQLRVVEEHEIAPDFFAYVRTLHDPQSVRVDLSLLKKWEKH